ncbi:MAG: flagellar export protein FliJ [Pigmentiphaga sp.]|nr:flagellar export protein FliJ [Pigmentiphaga sp.]
MPQPKPLDTLLGLARDQLDDATRQLGGLQNVRLGAARQLEQLEGYLADYRSRLQDAVQQGLSAAGWQNYQRFIGVLEGAIAEQRNVLQQAEGQLAQGQRHWQQQKRRLSSFDALAERQQRQELLLAGRREQKAADDYSIRLAHSRRNSRSL